MWSRRRAPVTSRVAAFCTDCSRCTRPPGMPHNSRQSPVTDVVAAAWKPQILRVTATFTTTRSNTFYRLWLLDRQSSRISTRRCSDWLHVVLVRSNAYCTDIFIRCCRRMCLSSHSVHFWCDFLNENARQTEDNLSQQHHVMDRTWTAWTTASEDHRQTSVAKWEFSSLNSRFTVYKQWQL